MKYNEKLADMAMHDRRRIEALEKLVLGKEGKKKEKRWHLVEEKMMKDLGTLGDKEGEFQEWWDTFVNIMTVLRPGTRKMWEALYQRRGKKACKRR